MRATILAALLLLASPAFAAEAGPIVESSTGVRFEPTPTVDGKRFQCLGAGVRRVFLFRAYAVTYCIEAARVDDALVGYLQKNHPDRRGQALQEALERDQRFFDQLVTAPGDKLAIMRLVRDVSKDRIASAFRDSLGEVLPPAKVEKLIDAIPGDGKDGQRILLYSRGSRLTIDIEGDARTIDDQEIANKLWIVWLGPGSVTPTLKESIASQIAARVGR